MAPTFESFTLLLKCVPYIYHLVQVKKNYIMVQALLVSSSKITVMTPANVAKLGIKIQSTDGSTQKIDDFMLEMFRIVLANFQVNDKLGKFWFF